MVISHSRLFLLIIAFTGTSLVSMENNEQKQEMVGYNSEIIPSNKNLGPLANKAIKNLYKKINDEKDSIIHKVGNSVSEDQRNLLRAFQDIVKDYLTQTKKEVEVSVEEIINACTKSIKEKTTLVSLCQSTLVLEKMLQSALKKKNISTVHELCLRHTPVKNALGSFAYDQYKDYDIIAFDKTLTVGISAIVQAKTLIYYHDIFLKKMYKVQESLWCDDVKQEDSNKQKKQSKSNNKKNEKASYAQEIFDKHGYQSIAEELSDDEMTHRLRLLCRDTDTRQIENSSDEKVVKRVFNNNQSSESFYRTNNSDIYQSAHPRVSDWFAGNWQEKLESGELGSKDFSPEENVFCHRFSSLISSFIGQLSKIQYCSKDNKKTGIEQADKVYYVPALIISYQINQSKVLKKTDKVMFEFALSRPIDGSSGMLLYHANSKLVNQSDYEKHLSDKDSLTLCENFFTKDFAKEGSIVNKSYFKTKKVVESIINDMNSKNQLSRICLDKETENSVRYTGSKEKFNQLFIEVQELFINSDGQKIVRCILIPCSVLKQDELEKRLK